MSNKDDQEMIKTLSNRVPMEMWKSKDLGGFTPLHHGAMAGNTKGLKFLMSKYGDVLPWNGQTNEGLTPLHLAYKEGNFETVDLLLTFSSVDFNITDKYGRLPVELNKKHKK